jgi:hypothetical protein
MFGADTAFVLGPFSLRGEVMYSVKRPYLRPGSGCDQRGPVAPRRHPPDPAAAA